MLRFAPYAGNVRRLIEGRCRPATRKITESVAEQERLEALLEGTKPPVPPEGAHLDDQFCAPFRYGRYPKASRFRRAGPTPGVYCAAETALTAVLDSACGSVAFFRAFARPAPLASQTWHLHLTGARVVLTNETLRQGHEFKVGVAGFEGVGVA